MDVISFVRWALSHAKRSSVPDGAVLCVDLQAVGRGGEWEYLYGTTGRRVTQSLLDERYANYYGRKAGHAPSITVQPTDGLSAA